MPLVSIIVPIYNVEKYLRECVDSILAQTLSDLEIILVDDGSPDACPSIVDEYAAKDKRIRAVHQQNGGYGKAVNHGMSLAQAPYVGIVEPDDFIAPEMYETLYALAELHHADVAKGWFYDNLDTEKRKHTKPFPCLIPSIEGCFSICEHPELLEMHPSVWSAIYRRSFLLENHIKIVEAPGAGWTDNPFQVQTLCLAQRICFTDTPLYYWRRTNVNAEDDLKDYRIPFLRSDEIHLWLEEHQFDDPKLLASLYARELAYIAIVSRMKKIEDKADCCKRIKAMVGRMRKDVVRAAPLRRSLLKAYRWCCISPAFYIFIRQLKPKFHRK